MKKYHIELTDEETLLLEGITLEPNASRHDYDAFRATCKANADKVPLLMESLISRDAVPKQRLSYWNDPEYQTDHRLKISRQGIFERNGSKGRKIYEHPHFIPFLRYFLFSAELPDAVITEFEKKVGNPDWLTSGDFEPIGKCARSLIREHGLRQSSAREEFYKLCLDVGLGLFNTDLIFGQLK